MTERESYKFGFLLRCRREGLTGEEAAGRAKLAAAIKRADPLVDGISAAAGGLASLPGKAVNTGLTGLLLALGAGAVGGGALGYAGGRMLDPGYDADDVRRQEMIAAYHQAADDMDDDLATRRELG